MKRHEMEAAIERAYDTRLSNDLEQVVALFTPDARVRMAGEQSAGSFVADASATPIRAALETMVATWTWLSVDFERILIDGDRACVQYRVGMRFVPTGDVRHSELCDIITFRDGKIADFVEFADTAVIAQLMAKAGARS